MRTGADEFGETVTDQVFKLGISRVWNSLDERFQSSAIDVIENGIGIVGMSDK
jgi:hypothetical protein